MVNIHIADYNDQSLLVAQEIFIVIFQITGFELFKKILRTKAIKIFLFIDESAPKSRFYFYVKRVKLRV